MMMGVRVCMWVSDPRCREKGGRQRGLAGDVLCVCVCGSRTLGAERKEEDREASPEMCCACAERVCGCGRWRKKREGSRER